MKSYPPFIQPFRKMLDSRRFVLLVIGLIANLIGRSRPELADTVNWISVLLVSLIAGYSVSDAATALSALPKSPAVLAADAVNEGVLVIAPPAVSATAPLWTPEFIEALAEAVSRKIVG